MIIYDEGTRMDVCPNCGITWTYTLGGYYCLECGMSKNDETTDDEIYNN